MTLVNTYKFEIDWSNNGFGVDGDDITAYVQSHDINSGTASPSPVTLVASAGTCTLVLNNSDRRFSPANTASPLYGRLVPGLPVRVQVTDGRSTWTAFRGFTRSFQADNSLYGAKHAAIECVDYVKVIQDLIFSMALQENVPSSDLIRYIVNAALLAPPATGTLTISAAPANNDSVTINGTTYIFKTVLSGAVNEVLIGTGRDTPSQNLAAAINNGDGAGTAYASNTTRGVGITAGYGVITSYDAPNQDSDVLLANTTAPQRDKLAQSIVLNTPGDTNTIQLYMKKVGTPSGTLTLRVETDNNYSPSGTLFSANATATVSESCSAPATAG
jgi:hypothetical protein